MNVFRLLYNLLFCLVLPLILVRVYWRARKEPRYSEDLRQRFGLVSSLEPGSIWVHGVSAGETIAAAGLVRELIAAGQKVVFSNMTPAGRERAEALFTQEISKQQLILSYAPYDFVLCVSAFFNRAKPQALIVIDTELWPNIIAQANLRQVPVYVVNGRMSEKSALGYRRVKWLSAPMFAGVRCVFAQSEPQAERFRELGAKNVLTAGSIKFDATLPEDFSEITAALSARFTKRKLLLAASTHPGEESVVLDAYQHFRQRSIQPSIKGNPKEELLVIAPRHIHRVDAVERLLHEAGLTFQKHSRGEPVSEKTQVYLVDTMGELIYFYGLCDSAFVGGSLVDVGGHNPMEPGLLAKPICMGSYRRNIADVADFFQDAGAMVKVNNAEDLANFWQKLEEDPAFKTSMATATAQVMANHRGALKSVLSTILPHLN